MQAKQPVTLNSSDVLIDGEEVSDYESFQFWADTFRHMDILQYQKDQDVKNMITNVPEKTTYEIEITAESLPPVVEAAWETGKRFAIHVENEYFNLDIDTARVADYTGNTVTIVAEALWRPLSVV